MKNISFVLSDKKYTEGHQLRHKILSEFNSDIDCFGNPVGEVVRKKRNILAPYRFYIAVENTKHQNYISEKFFDPIKSLTIPVYWGSEQSVKKLGFDLDGVLFFQDTSELESIINEVGPELYDDMLDAALYNRERLREIRNQNKLQYYMNSSIQYQYLHTRDTFKYGNADIPFSEVVQYLLFDRFWSELNLSPD